MLNDAYQTTTSWELMDLSSQSSRYLQGTHKAWSRLSEGEHVMTVLPIGKTPSAGDGGYYSLDSALKAKGML